MKKLLMVIIILFLSSTMSYGYNLGPYKWGMDYNEVKKMSVSMKEVYKNRFLIELKKNHENKFLIKSDFFDLLTFDSNGKLIAITQTYGPYENYYGLCETFGQLVIESAMEKGEPTLLNVTPIPSEIINSGMNPIYDIHNGVIELEVGWMTVELDELTYIHAEIKNDKVYVTKVTVWGKENINQ